MASIDKETALQIARFGWLAAQSSNKYIIEMAEEDLKGFVDDETKKALMQEFIRER